MASRSLQTLFLQAAADHRRWSRVGAVTVLVLVLAHLLVLGLDPEPGAAADATTPADALPAAVSAASEVEGRLAGLPRAIATGTDAIRDDLGRELTSDLARLADTVRALRADPPTVPGAEPEDEPPVAEPGSEIEDGPTVAERARRDIGSMDWILAVRDAEPGEPLLAALEPVVEGRITEPRIEDARRRWDEELVAAVRGTLDAAAAGISRLRGVAPDQRAVWDELTAASRQLLLETETAAPRAPEDPRWWQGAGETAGSEELDLDPGAEVVGRLLRADAPPLVEAAEALHRRALAARSELERRLAERARTAPAAGPEAATGGTRRAPVLPLALGIVLAALLAARTRTDRELLLAATLFVEAGGPVGVRDWTLARARTAPPRRFEAGLPRPGSWLARGLGAAVLASAWIVGLTVQLAGGIGLPGDLRLAGAAALALTLVLGACVHRVVVLGPVLHRIRRCAENEEPRPTAGDGPPPGPEVEGPDEHRGPATGAPADPPPTAELDAEGDERSDLDGHPLRS